MTLRSIALLTTAICTALPAAAHEPGQFIIRAGATQVAPQEESDLLTLNGSILSLGGGSSALGVDDDTQLGLTFTYQFHRNFSVELLAATPFHHTATGTGELDGLDIVDVRQLPPTLSLIYHLPTSDPLQPYVGVGVNYTTFFKEKLTGTASTTLAGLGLQGGKAKLDDSYGLALQAGVDYHLTDRLLLNASVRRIDIDTEATLTFTGGATLHSVIKVDPFVYTLGMGLVF